MLWVSQIQVIPSILCLDCLNDLIGLFWVRESGLILVYIAFGGLRENEVDNIEWKEVRIDGGVYSNEYRLKGVSVYIIVIAILHSTKCTLQNFYSSTTDQFDVQKLILFFQLPWVSLFASSMFFLFIFLSEKPQIKLVENLVPNLVIPDSVEWLQMVIFWEFSCEISFGRG